MKQFTAQQSNTATPFFKAAFSACTSASSENANMMILGTAIAVSIFVLLSLVSIIASIILSVVMITLVLSVLARITVLHIESESNIIRQSSVQTVNSSFA